MASGSSTPSARLEALLGDYEFEPSGPSIVRSPLEWARIVTVMTKPRVDTARLEAPETKAWIARVYVTLLPEELTLLSVREGRVKIIVPSRQLAAEIANPLDAVFGAVRTWKYVVGEVVHGPYVPFSPYHVTVYSTIKSRLRPVLTVVNGGRRLRVYKSMGSVAENVVATLASLLSI